MLKTSKNIKQSILKLSEKHQHQNKFNIKTNLTNKHTIKTCFSEHLMFYV